jgi:hypothetical protein
MSIFDNLIEGATGVRVRNGFERQPLTVERLDDVRSVPSSYMDEHTMQLRVTVTYRVTHGATVEGQAQVRESALRHLRATLYGDLLLLNSEILHAISDGDATRARDLCLKLRQEITG